VKHRPDVSRIWPSEAAPRLDRRSDDDQHSLHVFGRCCQTWPELPVSSPDDASVRWNPIALRHRLLACKLRPKRGLLLIEMRVERQLELDEERCDQEHARAAVGRQPAGNVERVPRRLLLEQRDNDGRPMSN
jgi:hypothetical protein